MFAMYVTQGGRNYDQVLIYCFDNEVRLFLSDFVVVVVVVKVKLNLISTGWPIQLGDSVSLGEFLRNQHVHHYLMKLNKKKPLNIERPQQFQLSLKI